MWKNVATWGAWLAQLVEIASLDLGVVSPSPLTERRVYLNKKMLLWLDVREITVKVLSSSIFMVSHIQTFTPFSVYFCVWWKKVVQFHSFACSSPVFPTPFVEETVFFSLHILSSFVED